MAFMIQWSAINWVDVGWAIMRLLTLLGLLGGANAGTYYLADKQSEERTTQAIEGRQQENLGQGVLLADLKRQVLRLEDEQDRMKDQLRALWRKVGKEARTDFHEDDLESSDVGMYAHVKEVP